MKTYLAALFVAVALLTGCTSAYQVKNPINKTVVLKPNASVYVACPADGRFENTSYPGSGKKTCNVITAAFSRHAKQVEPAPEPVSFSENIAAAKKGAFDYAIIPTVVQWEDRATEWSGKLDRVEIELRTVETATGNTLAIGQIKGHSKWATLGGDVPENLLPTPINAYVDSLFTGELKLKHNLDDALNNRPLPTGKN